MTLFIAVTLALLGLFIALLRSERPLTAMLSVLSMSAAYAMLYLAAPIRLVQDRLGYYNLYNMYDWGWVSSHSTWPPSQGMAENDVLSALMLVAFPDGMTLWQFSLFFLAIVLLLLVVVLLAGVRRKIIALRCLPLVFAFILMDRMFMDLVFNVTQSTVSGLLFLVGFVGFGLLGMVLFGLAALGMHSRMLLLVVSGLPFTLMARILRWLPSAFVGISFLAYLIRHVDPYPFSSIFGFFGYAFRETVAPSGLAGAMTMGFELSSSLSLQLFVGIVVPVAVLFLNRRDRQKSELKPGPGHSGILDFALISSGIVLLLFPEVGMVQRLLVIPLVLLPLFLEERQLVWLAAMKSALYLCYLPVIMTKG